MREITVLKSYVRYIFLLVFTASLVTGCSSYQPTKNVWKSTKSFWNTYVSPPATVDFEEKGNLSPQALSLTHSMMGIDVELTRLERVMLNADKPPTREWLSSFLTSFPWISGFAGVKYDGTILGHDGSLSERVARAIHAHITAGTHVMIATGRGIHGTQLALEQIGINSGVTVCSNGAITLGLGRTFLPNDSIGGRPIFEPRSKCRRLDVGFPFRILNYHTFDPRPEIALLHSAVPNAILAVEELDGPRRVSQHFPPGELSGQSVVFPVDQLGVPEATRLTVRALGMGSQELLDIVDSMGMKGVEYAVGWTAWLDVSPEGVSKASALESVREAIGVAPGATVAVGDGGNDPGAVRQEDIHLGVEGAGLDGFDLAVEHIAGTDLHAGRSWADGTGPLYGAGLHACNLHAAQHLWPAICSSTVHSVVYRSI